MVYQLDTQHDGIKNFISAAAKRTDVEITEQNGLDVVFKDTVSHRTIVKLIRYAYAEKAEKETGLHHLTRDDVHKNVSGIIMPTELFAFDNNARAYGADIMIAG